MSTIDHAIHDAVVTGANYRERKLLTSGDATSAATAMLHRLRRKCAAITIALALVMIAAVIGPFVATQTSANALGVPPLAVVGYVVPVFFILHSRHRVSRDIFLLDFLLRGQEEANRHSKPANH